MNVRILLLVGFIAGLAILYFAVAWLPEALGWPGIDSRWVRWVAFLLGYGVCSGANVGYFAFSERDLKITVARGETAPPDSPDAAEARRAKALLSHLRDPNWTLAAILLTNVLFGVEVSQLSEDLFVGLLAVVMPVISITLFGEFFAQATFLRYAAGFCYNFSPLIWLLKFVTAPISWPLARAVDALYGREALRRLSEKDLLSELELELREFGRSNTGPHADVLDPREVRMLMNVAKADDEPAVNIGQVLDPATCIALPFEGTRPQFPDDLEQFVCTTIDLSPHPWFVLCDASDGRPRLLLDADGFVRDFYHCLHSDNLEQFQVYNHIFRAQVYHDEAIRLGEVVSNMLVHEGRPGDEVIDIDVALIWTPTQQWIITGGDILGRLLRGVARKRTVRLRREAEQRARSKISPTPPEEESLHGG